MRRSSTSGDAQRNVELVGARWQAQLVAAHLVSRGDLESSDAGERASGNADGNGEAGAARIQLSLQAEVLVEGALGFRRVDQTADDDIGGADKLESQRDRPSRLLGERIDVPAL